MHDEKCHSEFNSYLMKLYGGMFAGLVMIACIACCFGMATNLTELAGFLFASLVSATLLFSASQFLNSFPSR